ncbi:Putative ribonuclease H protein [Dendrobium catenatum]|uniref:Ribonuclease H protein n=1 Tax=Dendrobium catenatum TaxID=906689 RepID=A0A2I0X7L0_9ASPA|nr:Putative ribonuclease H protein [Dendrobium catenatum]
MGNNRAPGIDGITSTFLKFYWEIIRKDVISAILHFFATNVMCQSWKETLMVLIPKMENANMPSKFRPIRLCQSFYKIVAKVLINRLKLVLSTIISEEQGAFVPGRSISNHGLMAQEMMSKFKYSTQKSGLMALKIDMEQAYDCMSWKTLQEVMNLMGFKKRFITWVMQCIFEPKFILLMNGNRTRWIDAKSGLRQGCPLSPYLFILCSELLSKSFKQRGVQLGVQVARNTVSISHLLYADDILVFAEANRSNAHRIMNLLGDYCCWTGQKINCGKSAILFNKKCPSWRKGMISRMMGYKKVDSLEYLGLPLVMRRLNGADFSKIMRIAFEKINLWGRKHLSLAGRALLIRTSLLSVPMYAMTHTSIPNGVLMAIERMGRRFLWQKDASSRGMHYVGWKELCQPTEFGGLGFHCLTRWKGALRARVVWDLIQNKDSILYKVLMAKYGMKLWEYEHGKKVSITWKVIQDGAKVLRPILRWNIVDGSQIDVMHDVWIMNRNIAKWPTFVNIEEVENMKVCNLLNNSFQWNVEMVKNCFGNTMAERILAINISTENQEDNPELIYSRLSMTVAAMAYRNSEEKGINEFSWLKQLKLHPREHFFWWRLLRDAIPTTHWLNRRTLADTSLCPWGCNEEENLDHQHVIHHRVAGPDTTFLQDFKQVLFQYTHRNSNRVADFCAHLALGNEFTFFDVNNSEFPSTLLSLLREESDRV